MTCQSRQELNSSGYIRLLWESDDDNRNGHAAIFEVKFGKTSEGAVRESRERSTEQLFADPESVASALEGSDLGKSGETTLSRQRVCINDGKRLTACNQIRSVKTEMLCVRSPRQVGFEYAC